ncbi:hypothetical protein CBL21_26650, partial [Shigella flexneri]
GHQANKNGSREYLLLSGNSSFVSINIDGRDCCQTGQFSQDVADGALTASEAVSPFEILIAVVTCFKPHV